VNESCFELNNRLGLTRFRKTRKDKCPYSMIKRTIGTFCENFFFNNMQYSIVKHSHNLA